MDVATEWATAGPSGALSRAVWSRVCGEEKGAGAGYRAGHATGPHVRRRREGRACGNWATNDPDPKWSAGKEKKREIVFHFLVFTNLLQIQIRFEFKATQL